MLVAGRSRKFLGVGRGSKGRGGERGLATAAREVGRGIGGFVAVQKTGLAVLLAQAMKPAMLVLEFGQAQPILQTQRDLHQRVSQLGLASHYHSV